MDKPNRTKVLIGFGALAVVLIVAIAFWPSNFRNEEASGAIGVVQKHHAPQITQKDVILGDEHTRNQQSVLYRDYFADATKLQAISASLMSRDVAAANINLASQQLLNQLNNDFAVELASAIDAAQMQAKQTANAQLAQEVEALAAQAKADRTLSLADMEALASKFSNIAQAQSKMSDQFALANEDLAAALSSRDEQTAASKLHDAEQALANRNVANVSLADRSEYLSNISLAAKTLSNLNLASEEMASRMKDAEALANAAGQLAHTALQNVEEQTNLQMSLAAEVEQMQAKASAARNAGNFVAARELAAFEQQLGSSQQAFASHTASSFQAELAAMTEFAQNRAQYAKLSNAQLQASMVANAQLSNQLYGKLADTAEIANTAAMMQRAMLSRELGSFLGNQQALLSRDAETLASRKQE
jgi:hypothetical protein